MTAAEETPPGPQGGTGAATVTIDLAKNTLCYDVSWSKEVGEPNAGHIHKGKKGLAGPIVVPLQPARQAEGLRCRSTTASSPRSPRTPPGTT